MDGLDARADTTWIRSALKSFPLQMGLVSITILATLPHLRSPGCPSQENCKEASSQQLLLLYLALLLSSIGSGGRKPCVVTFAADQIDMSKSKVESRKWNFFNWYTFCIGMGSLAALTIVVYVQDNVGWGLGFGIPTIAMTISVIAFVAGSPLYRKVKPKGSPFVRLAQVVVAAVLRGTKLHQKMQPCCTKIESLMLIFPTMEGYYIQINTSKTLHEIDTKALPMY